jgi:PRTRC genetic system protein A
VNKRDESIQKERPTIMVPQHEELPPCPVRKVRFLMGKQGLYLETVMPFGHLIRQLWESPRTLPYGDVEEVDTFQTALQDIFHAGLFLQAQKDAALYARNGKEWIGHVFYDQAHDGYVYAMPAFSSDAISVEYDARKHGLSLAVDIHSHGTLPTGFSSDDDKDDKGGVRIAIVLGDFQETGGGPMFEYACRYVVEGMFFDLTQAHAYAGGGVA